MAALNLAIAVASGLVLAGVLASKLSSRVGIPSLLLFLAVGMLAGSDGIGRIDFDNAELAQSLGVTALAFILFAGGLDTSWSSVRPVLGQAVAMATAGVLATALIVGAVAVWVLGVPLWTGLLVGAIVSSTDAAAVFAVLRSRSVSLRNPIRPLLELESGSNDPMAVFLTIGFLELVTERSSSLFELIPMFAAQMAVGGVVFPGRSQRPRMPRGSPPGGMAAVEPRSLSRRQLLGGLLTLPAIGVLLSACSGGDAATTATTGSTGSTASTYAGAPWRRLVDRRRQRELGGHGVDDGHRRRPHHRLDRRHRGRVGRRRHRPDHRRLPGHEPVLHRQPLPGVAHRGHHRGALLLRQRHRRGHLPGQDRPAGPAVPPVGGHRLCAAGRPRHRGVALRHPRHLLRRHRRQR
ncbi:MAG: cation:proton antiporter [Acidimicrobiales bacterium]